MRFFLNYLMRRRARELALRLAPHVPVAGTLLDIGCGTGHNAVALREFFPRLQVIEADVVDMKTVGGPPVLIHDARLPFADGAFPAALLLFILHYPQDPGALVREALRVASHKLIVVQSTWVHRPARAVLQAREWIQGRGAFTLAKAVRFVKNVECPMRPIRYFDREMLDELLTQPGWVVTRPEGARVPLAGLSRDLYILERR